MNLEEPEEIEDYLNKQEKGTFLTLGVTLGDEEGLVLRKSFSGNWIILNDLNVFSYSAMTVSGMLCTIESPWSVS